MAVSSRSPRRGQLRRADDDDDGPCAWLLLLSSLPRPLWTWACPWRRPTSQLARNITLDDDDDGDDAAVVVRRLLDAN